MSDLKDLNLTEIAPPNIAEQDELYSILDAANLENARIAERIKHVIHLGRIHELESEIVDLLAWEYHVDFYNPDLPLDVRRNLVKNHNFWHVIKGTKKAVELMLEVIFGSGWITEWFEYGGEPHFFRVISRNTDITTSRYEEFIEALNAVKRKSSWLEYVMSIKTAPKKEIQIRTVVVGARKSSVTLSEAPRPTPEPVMLRIGGVFTRRSSRTLTEHVEYAVLRDANGLPVKDASGADVRVRI